MSRSRSQCHAQLRRGVPPAPGVTARPGLPLPGGDMAQTRAGHGAGLAGWGGRTVGAGCRRAAAGLVKLASCGGRLCNAAAGWARPPRHCTGARSSPAPAAPAPAGRRGERRCRRREVGHGHRAAEPSGTGRSSPPWFWPSALRRGTTSGSGCPAGGGGRRSRRARNALAWAVPLSRVPHLSALPTRRWAPIPCPARAALWRN